MAQVLERLGVYTFLDEAGGVIYVGKASDLRARLRNDRAGGDGRFQVPFLAADARSVETIVTRTEQVALLLEDTLIETHKPLHNLRLEDEKISRMLRLDLGERIPRSTNQRGYELQAHRSGWIDHVGVRLGVALSESGPRVQDLVPRSASRTR